MARFSAITPAEFAVDEALEPKAEPVEDAMRVQTMYSDHI